MNLNNLDDNQIGYVLSGLRMLMVQWSDVEDYDEADLLQITSLYISLKNVVNEIIKKINNPDIPETLARQPNKGEGTVLGQANYKKI